MLSIVSESFERSANPGLPVFDTSHKIEPVNVTAETSGAWNLPATIYMILIKVCICTLIKVIKREPFKLLRRVKKWCINHPEGKKTLWDIEWQKMSLRRFNVVTNHSDNHIYSTRHSLTHVNFNPLVWLMMREADEHIIDLFASGHIVVTAWFNLLHIQTRLINQVTFRALLLCWNKPDKRIFDKNFYHRIGRCKRD